MPPEYLLLMAAFGVLTAYLTYLRFRPTSRADAFATMENTNVSVSTRLDIMGANMYAVQTELIRVQTDYGLLKVAFEQVKSDLVASNAGWAGARKFSDELLIKIDGMPAKLLELLAENRKLKQEAAGLPDVPAVPDAELTALAAQVKEAENKVAPPSTGGAKPLHAGDTVTLTEAIKE